MFVHPITAAAQKHYFTAFKSKVVFDDPKDSASPEVKEAVDDFEEHTYLYDKLGEGRCSVVYSLMPENLIIKKTAREYKDFDNFAHEAKVLMDVPDDFDNSQHFKSRVKTEKGNFYLISTYKKGQPANIKKNPLTPDKLRLILDSFFELDKAGIYHMDLSNNNILIDQNAANIIDYQWAKKFSPFNYQQINASNGVLFPNGIIPANIQNYESCGMGSYLHRLSKDEGKYYTRDFLASYVKEKSKYHKNRYEYFKNYAKAKDLYYNEKIQDKNATTINSKKHNYDSYSPLKLERALSIVYENPSDDVLDIELLRIEMLRADKKAYYFVDPNNTEKINTLNGIPYTAGAILSSKNFEARLKEYEDKYQNDKYMLRYIRYNKKIAEYTINNYKKWYPDTLDFYRRLAMNDYDIDYSRHLDADKNGIRHFEKFKTFDSVLSSKASRADNCTTQLTLLEQRAKEKYFAELSSYIQELKKLEMFKYYTFNRDNNNKNLYDYIKDIEEASQASKSMINQNKPIDAYSAAHVLLKLTADLSQTSYHSRMEDKVFDSAYDITYSLKDAISSMISDMRTNLILVLSKDESFYNPNDFQLTSIPSSNHYNQENDKQERSFFSLLLDWITEC